MNVSLLNQHIDPDPSTPLMGSHGPRPPGPAPCLAGKAVVRVNAEGYPIDAQGRRIPSKLVSFTGSLTVKKCSSSWFQQLIDLVLSWFGRSNQTSTPFSYSGKVAENSTIGAHRIRLLQHEGETSIQTTLSEGSLQLTYTHPQDQQMQNQVFAQITGVETSVVEEALTQEIPSEESINGLEGLITQHPILLKGFAPDERQQIITSLLPKMVQAEQYLLRQYHSYSPEERPSELRISGKSSDFLSIQIGHRKYTASVSISKEGKILFSFPRPRDETIYGGFSKITFKAYSTVANPTKFEGLAKATCGDLIGETDYRKAVGSRNLVLDTITNPRNIVKPSWTVERSSERSPTKKSTAYMPLMTDLQDYFYGLSTTIHNLPPSTSSEELITHYENLLLLLSDMAEGMASLDRHNLVHNDVKAHNFLVREEEVDGRKRYVAYVNDFDLVTTQEEASQKTFQMHEGRRLAFFSYYLSDQTRGRHADIYALGETFDRTICHGETLGKLRTKYQRKNPEDTETIAKLGTIHQRVTRLIAEMKKTKEERPRYSSDGLKKTMYDNREMTYEKILQELQSLQKELSEIRSKIAQ